MIAKTMKIAKKPTNSQRTAATQESCRLLSGTSVKTGMIAIAPMINAPRQNEK